jgi:hypothetical protein
MSFESGKSSIPGYWSSGDATLWELVLILWWRGGGRQEAINYCRPGRAYKDIGGIIEDVINKHGYTTVRYGIYILMSDDLCR